MSMSIVSTVALACIALNFVRAGCVHFLRFPEMCSMLAVRGWPAPRAMLAVGSAVQIAAGLGLLWPPSRHACAFALLAFTVWASVTLLDFWRLSGRERVGVANGFFSNVAVCGGLLLASVS
jgi:putative oxidoreductase